MTRYFLLVVFLILTDHSAFGQSNIRVTPRLYPDSAFVGDDISYVLTIERAKSQTFLYPSDKDSAFGKLELRSIDKKILKDENEKVSEEAVFTLAAYDTGRVFIPDVSLRYLDGTKENTITAKGGSVYIKSLLDTSKHVIDIKTVISPQFPYWIVIAVLAGVLAIAALSYFLYKKYKNKPTVKKEIIQPSRSPYEIAWEKLLALENVKLETQEEFKRYYTGLSLILREFLELQYHILALEQTASEIYDALYFKLRPEELELVRKILDQSDLVKFAKFMPTTFDAKECFGLCSKFLNAYKVASSETKLP